MELTERVKRAKEYDRKVYAELMENPINLDELFDAVVKTVRYNYVGYEQKKHYYNPAEYHTYIYSHFRYQSLTYEMLVRSLHQFLGDMHDRRLRLLCDDWIDYRNLSPRYRVRAFGEDALYVTQASPGSGLNVEDIIRKVQGMTPEKVRALTRHTCFYSAERERELWGGYLRMARSLDVERADGHIEKIQVSPLPAAEDPRTPAERYPSQIRICSRAGGQAAALTDEGDTVILQIGWLDPDMISGWISEYGQRIGKARKLILDLRTCAGGEEGAGWDLFPYLVDSPTKLSSLIADEGSYVLCTKNNCDARIAQLEAFRAALEAQQQSAPCLSRDEQAPGQESRKEQGNGKESQEEGTTSQEIMAEQARNHPQMEKSESPQDPEILMQRALLDHELTFYRDHYGKGLVYREPDPIEEEEILPAPEAPAKIVLLTDTYCEKEGEQFAAMCQRCGSRVTTIGRPTMGTLDYSDNIELKIHEHMTLSYPIRMTRAAFEGRGISEKGLPVDRYIAWSPQELERDVVLEQALAL